ncbi:RDD family protein [Methanoregula sp.]|uniref:RDD family protein n=1 Tax=Methanoregula sp. TaxID=2052170 RepID=UPI003C706F13
MADAFPGTSPLPEPVPTPVPASEPLPVAEPERPPFEHAKTLHLAKWSTRFWAWLIDIILIVLFLNIVRGILEPFWTLHFIWDYQHWGIFELGIETFFFFLYWTIFESYKGQSIGKMVMNIRVVNRDGTRIHWGTAAIESLGKAFIPVLALDCLIGWLAMPQTKLRVFNRISNTIVIKTDYREPEGVLYVREKE